MTKTIITDKDSLRSYLRSLDREAVTVFDWETTGLRVGDLPLGLSLYQPTTGPVFIPIDFFFTKGIPLYEVRDLCNKYLEGIPMIGHNAKFDLIVNKVFGFIDFNLVADTLVMVHLYDPSLEKQLEKRIKLDFSFEKKQFKEITGKKWEVINWSAEGDSLLEVLADYACEDTYWEYKLYKKYLPLLDEDALRVMNRIELPFIWVLRDMKIRGVQIDVDYLWEMAKNVEVRLKEVVELIYEEAGCVFNLNSPKQKQEVFFDKLKMPCLKMTKKGGRSTDSATMEELAEMGFPIGQHMVRYSELQKLYSGYLLAIPEMVDENDVLRGDINSCGTETGRASSSNPNLQNQPNNDEFPVRRGFVARPGYVLIDFDYSQLELRVMAHMSKDPKFLHVFRTGGDPHSDVAESLGISRKGAKVVNFGVLYGMGPDKLAATIGVSVEEARKIITQDYMTTYHGFAKWKTATEKFAQKNGYVKNLFGRVRRLPDAAADPYRRDNKKFFAALRQSVNTIIQGTGADIVKLAMNQIYRRFKEEQLDAHLLLQVHDEVLAEASLQDYQRAVEIIKDSMANTVKLDIPLDVDGKTMAYWSQMKDDSYKGFSQDSFLLNLLMQ